MKPYIAPERTLTGKMAFKCQCEGLVSGDLLSGSTGQILAAYVLPNGHTPQASWGLLFVFESGLVADFSAACTHALDWQEVGSLNIGIRRQSSEIGAPDTRGEKTQVVTPPICLIAADKMIYEDDEVMVECGLVLQGSNGQEIVVAAGISPGSVSVLTPFSVAGSFEPQFPLPLCRRQPL